MTRYTEGFSHFVTFMTAPVASGWSDGRVELAPTGKAPPYHGAHPTRTFKIRLAIRRGQETRGFHTLVQKGGSDISRSPKGLRLLSLYGVSSSLSVVA